jgi:integrase
MIVIDKGIPKFSDTNPVQAGGETLVGEAGNGNQIEHIPNIIVGYMPCQRARPPVYKIFQHYGVRKPSYRLPPIDSIFDDEAGVRFVRSRHIPARTLPALVKAIKADCAGSPMLARYAEMAVLLAYRGGLRLGEVVKLRMRDIEPSQDKWLFIVDNRFETNKTNASRRQIPFAALLNDSEHDAFDAFVRDRADRQGFEQPLFQDPKSGAPLNAMWLSQIVSLALNHVLGGGGWTFHHLRHAAANNLFLAIEEESELCAQFAGWSAKQCRLIRDRVLPNCASRQTRYYALAAFMGHADPRQTFESYLHVIEPVLARRRARQPIKSEVALYAAALGAGTQRLTPLKSDGDVAPLIVRKLKKFIAKPEVNRPSEGRIQKSRLGPRTSIKSTTPADCRRALQIIEGGGSIEEAAREADIDQEIVAQWTENARVLASLKTKYGGPRLFYPDRIARATATMSSGGVPIIPLKRELLLPSDPKSLADWHDFDQLFAHLERLGAIPKLRPELEFAISHVIEKFDCRNSGVAFHRPEDFERFLHVFDGSHVESARWHLQLRLGDHAPAEPWTAQLSKGMTYSDSRNSEKQAPQAADNDIKRAKGHVRLHLLHANWKGAGKGSFTKYTAHSLPYVVHMMAIMRGGDGGAT